MNFKGLTIFLALVASAFTASADNFIWQTVTNAAVKNSLQPGAGNLAYNAVANAGASGGFMCVGSNFLASLAVTNVPLSATNGGYLLATNGWFNSSSSASSNYSSVYLNGVAFGGNAFVAAGEENANFQYGLGSGFSPTGSGWSLGKNANVGVAYDAKGIACNPNSGNFSLVTSSFQEAYAAAANWADSNSLVWTKSVNTNQAIVEFFRGVTAFGADSFALCGFNGDIRVSENNGASWFVSNQGNLSDPTNLYSIAADTSNVLVAVGDHSSLWVSTNAGASWIATDLSQAVTGTTFNSVGYTGPDDGRFIAVGMAGQAYAAADSAATVVNPANWTRISIPGLNTNNTLRGVSYAVSGPFQGIGMMVGDNGTIVVGGTPPPVPTNSIGIVTNLLTAPNQTNQFIGSTNVFAVVVTNAFHPAISTTIDWYGTNGLPLAFGSTTYEPTNVICGYYTNYSALARDVRTGFTSSNSVTFPFWLIPPAPPIPATALAEDITNMITANEQTNAPIWAEVLTNYANPPGNFLVNWYSAAVGGSLVNNGTETNLNNLFFHTPANAVICGIYTNWAQTVATTTYGVNGAPVPSTNRTPVAFTIVPQQPYAPVGWTNPLTSPNQVNVPLVVSVVTNLNNPVANFTVIWYSDPLGVNALYTNSAPVSGNQFSYTPASVNCGTYTNWTRTVAEVTVPGGLNLVSTGLTPVVYQLIPPQPFAPVGWTNLLTQPNQINPPLAVSVVTNANNPATDFTVIWYSDPLGVNALYTNAAPTSANQFAYTPASVLCGTYTNWTRTLAVVTVPPGQGLVSQGLTPVVYQLLPPAPTNTISPAGTTNVLGQPYSPIWVDLLVNSANPPANFMVDWYLAAIGGSPLNNGTEINVNNQFYHTPTNPVVCGIFTNWAETVATTTYGGSPVRSTNRTAVAFTVIPPPPYAPEGWTNVLTQPNQINAPLLVSVVTNASNPAADFSVIWYSDPLGVNPLYTNSAPANGNQFAYMPTNVLCGTYTNWAQTIATVTVPGGLTLVSTGLTPVVYELVPPAPTNTIPIADTTNVLGQPCAPIWVDLLVNAANPPANFIVDWYSASTAGLLLDNGTETNLNNQFYHTPNTPLVCGVFTNWAQTVATNTSGGSPVLSTNRTAVSFVVVPPAPLDPVGATNCAQSAGGNGILAVTVYSDVNNPPGALYANWYADSNRLILVATQTNLYQPTNLVAGTYVYYVATVVAGNPSLKSTNLTQVTLVLNPLPGRPTVIGNGINNGSPNMPVQVTNILSASFNPGDTNSVTTGPVVVDWYDAPSGGNLLASATNYYNPTNFVVPLDANTSSNYYYYTQSRVLYTNASCDCVCVSSGRSTNILTIYPTPTATLTITTNDFSAIGMIAGYKNTAGYPYADTNLIGAVNGGGTNLSLDVNFQAFQYTVTGHGNHTKITLQQNGFTNVVLLVTNHFVFTGVSNWVATLSDGYTTVSTTNSTTNGTHVWTELLYTNLPTTNFTFSILSVSNPVSQGVSMVTNSVQVSINQFGALVGGDATVCGGESNDVQITALLFGLPPFTNIVWSDGYTNVSWTNNILTRGITNALNYSGGQVITIFTITNLTDALGSNTASAQLLLGSATITVDPVSTNPPVLTVPGTNYTCAEVPVVLSVMPANGFTFDWYSDTNMTTALAIGTNNYQPPTGAPGSSAMFTNWVTMRYDDDNLTNTCVSPYTPVVIIQIACTNPVVIMPPTNGQGVITWYGNDYLLSATNLNPAVWSTVTNGAFNPDGTSTNVFMYSNTVPPQEFFRLSSTNAP